MSDYVDPQDLILRPAWGELLQESPLESPVEGSEGQAHIPRAPPYDGPIYAPPTSASPNPFGCLGPFPANAKGSSLQGFSVEHDHDQGFDFNTLLPRFAEQTLSYQYYQQDGPQPSNLLCGTIDEPFRQPGSSDFPQTRVDDYDFMTSSECAPSECPPSYPQGHSWVTPEYVRLLDGKEDSALSDARSQEICNCGSGGSGDSETHVSENSGIIKQPEQLTCPEPTCKRKEPFASRPNLLRHMKNHGNGPKLHCNAVGCSYKGTGRKDKMRDHFRQAHHEDTEYTCPSCSRPPMTRDLLAFHYRKHHVSPKNPPSMLCDSFVDVNCPIDGCPKWFLFSWQGDVHLYLKHIYSHGSETRYQNQGNLAAAGINHETGRQQCILCYYEIEPEVVHVPRWYSWEKEALPDFKRHWDSVHSQEELHQHRRVLLKMFCLSQLFTQFDKERPQTLASLFDDLCPPPK